MVKAGYVDDNTTLIDDYKTRFMRRGIELVYCDICKTKEDVIEWIVNSHIECVMIDHRLDTKYDLTSTSLVAYINSVMPDIICIDVTNYRSESIATQLVGEVLIRDRDQLVGTSLEFDEFCMEIVNASEVFKNRIALRLAEYEDLLKKRKGRKDDQEPFDADDEERLISLFKMLKAYGEIDDIPVELIKPETETRMNSIIDKLDRLIEDIEKRS